MCQLEICQVLRSGVYLVHIAALILVFHEISTWISTIPGLVCNYIKVLYTIEHFMLFVYSEDPSSVRLNTSKEFPLFSMLGFFFFFAIC